MQEKKGGFHYHRKRVWHFIWKDDSIWSWLANIVIAFLLIRFIVYPILGVALGSSYPIVAVVSESMEHGTSGSIICGQQFETFPESFSNYWKTCGSWYEERGISQEQFRKSSFSNGFNKGDVIILWRAHPHNIKVGDVLVFQANKPQPIIHRVVRIWQENGLYYYQTKGDHNSNSIFSIGEDKIAEERVLGKGVLRIPYLGWMKILVVEALQPFGINIVR